ncbi:siroheme synthase CysG [Methylophilus medardicus]|uniref:Siroheme synthase n=1 Tax=Methylophilus medardicus TaxID=2588534 RepID=A0A5B8CTV6_9PROT|nr:siroheme synthase CysG [Methylophilus medardicus]QDC44744.1 uroporphyrinogen-III C-methyltransferase [Methylophilus medardicus]QDC49751.1 uroporphyrinogen-III C-methyltransferase [Methylophilus medardicus]QDC53456.1 uroporphyrinogen-III C-methyltransferase [Methylophilus medardicus]
MQALPIFFNIAQRPCIVIGGGDVATRKVLMLRKAQGQITVISPALCDELRVLAEQGEIAYVPAEFHAEQLTSACLVIAATDDESVNEAVSIAAKRLNIPVNVVDAPALCTFTMGSIIDRSPIVIAISSEGNAPVLARHIRSKIETMLPAAYGRIANIAGEFREQVKAKFTNMPARRRFWEDVLNGPLVERVLSGQEHAARELLASLLQQTEDAPTRGEVYLVGGGPGDPDLLTFRALRLMQQCDVCVYDKLVSKEVMELVRRDAELVFVGKSRDQHTLPQEEINQLLARLALEGKRVLRLKGGDPFIFGRGGEEIETLMQHGVPFQVVPGITAANGVSTYAGIPLTHRDYAQACLFITGHLKDGTVDLDWQAMARPNQTVVIYMGLVGLAQICSNLIAQGVSPDMPAAVIQQGTTQKQRVVESTLQHLAAEVAAAGLKPPSLTIIGEVVKLRARLNWFTPAE